MAVTMKSAVFWDVKSQFVPHGKYITSPLQKQPINEFFTAVTMKSQSQSHFATDGRSVCLGVEPHVR
jgi:hypothetical protein